LTALLILAGGGAMIEMVYHLQLNQALGPNMKFLGFELNASGFAAWAGAGALLLLGIVLFEFTRRRFAGLWNQTQEEIEHEIQRREAVAP
jgi:branched-chain amino acid transport system permease protein